MSKYSGLPDIDTAPDVYETNPPERPEVTSVGLDDDAESDTDVPAPSDAIDTRSVNAAHAANAFRSSRPSFLAADSYELTGTAAEKESPLARLMRLQQETRELQHVLTQSEAPPANAASMLSQLHHLERHIQKMREASSQLNARDLTQSMLDALQCIPETQRDTGIAPWAERVTALEQRLGVNVTQTDVPLAETVKRLETRMQLLTQPRHLDTIVARAKALSSELERVDERRKQFAVAAEEDDALAKLDELYALQSRIEPLEPLAPALLTRLQTLEKLHASAANFHTSLASVEAQQTKIQGRFSELESLLQKAERSMEENQAVTQRNLESLTTRLDALTHTSPP